MIKIKEYMINGSYIKPSAKVHRISTFLVNETTTKIKYQLTSKAINLINQMQ